MIRRYKPADMEGLLTTWWHATQQAHPFMTQDFLERERTNIRDIYIPNTETWVCLQENEVVGFASIIHHDGGIKEVGALFVEPACHGQGLGYDLMRQVTSLYAKLVLDVFEKNTLGRRFYDRFGFHEVKRHLHPETNEMLCRLVYPS